MDAVIEAVGLALIVVAAVCAVVVAWSVCWQAGLGAVAVEAAGAGAVLVVIGNRLAARKRKATG